MAITSRTPTGRALLSTLQHSDLSYLARFSEQSRLEAGLPHATRTAEPLGMRVGCDGDVRFSAEGSYARCLETASFFFLLFFFF